MSSYRQQNCDVTAADTNVATLDFSDLAYRIDMFFFSVLLFIPFWKLLEKVCGK